uniref:PCNA-interacting partner n=1 Tax=Neogobius melanostomus TaxID=47308 RepID=A0A8C6V740_9GOBI
MQSPEELFGQMVKTFRRECHRVTQSERTTIHGADGMLMVLQLAMAEVTKRQSGDLMMTLSDILLAWKHLILRKLNFQTSSVPLESYNLIIEEYNSFLKRSNTVDLLDIYSMYKELKVYFDPEVSLNATHLLEYLSGNTKVTQVEETSSPSTPSSTPTGCSSQVKSAVRRVFCSYLSLLVNSKNDMAVALTLDVPKRNLGRNAFTAIKHAAREGNTSLFLAVTSFVRAIQLGGKGYAPAESNPLRKHVKGLSDFVQFIDNLEEILGEIPNPSVCCTRLVTAIRALLVKGRRSGDPVFIAADKTAEELKERIFQLYQNHKMTTDESMTGISPARPRAYAINHATAIGGRDSVKVIMALLDEEALIPPCQNKADLLSEDQPILNGEESICVLTLYRSPDVSSGCSPLPLKGRVQSRLELLKPKVKDKVIRSQFVSTYTNDELPLSRVLQFPSTSQVPTCIHPAPKPKWTPVEDEPSSVDAVFSDNSVSECSSTEFSSLQQLAAHGPWTENARNIARLGNRKNTCMDVQIKANKRKRVETNQPGGSENDPPKKKPVTTVKNPVKAISKTSNKKLIVGQSKLTNFFRL